MDLDGRVVERWRPGDVRPQVLIDVLTWQPGGASEPLVIDPSAVFGGILD